MDVRRPDEWAEGHIRNATFMPSLADTRDTTVLDACKRCRIAVYCRSGRRSKQAAEVLESAGFESVVDVLGVQQWTSAGEQLVHGASREPACNQCTSEASKTERDDATLVIVAYALGGAAVLAASVAGCMRMRGKGRR